MKCIEQNVPECSRDAVKTRIVNEHRYTTSRARAVPECVGAHHNAVHATQIAFDARGAMGTSYLPTSVGAISLSYADKESTFRLMLSPQHPPG